MCVWLEILARLFIPVDFCELEGGGIDRYLTHQSLVASSFDEQDGPSADFT